MRSIDLLPNFAGPVRNIITQTVTNVSIEISWTGPAETNGVIEGYSVYANNVPVSLSILMYVM